MDEQKSKVVRTLRKPVNGWQIISIFFTLIAVLCFAYAFNLFGIAQPAPTNQSSAPIIVSQSQLINDYANNEISADNEYQNHYLQIAGVVQSISKDLFGNPYIVLASTANDIGNGVQCAFSQNQESELASLQTGQPITVEGIGNGYTLGAVMVKNCSIVTH